jgi:hypothetical protein
MINDLFLQTLEVIGKFLCKEIESTTPGEIHSLTNEELQIWLYNRLGIPSEADVSILRDKTGFRFTSSTFFGQDAAKLKTLYSTLSSLRSNW